MKPAGYVLLLVAALVLSCRPLAAETYPAGKTPAVAAPGAGPSCVFDANTVVQGLAPLNQSGTGPFNAAVYGNCDPRVDPACVRKYGPKIGGPPLQLSWIATVQNAYNMAPPEFKEAMCKLKYIYIDNNKGSPNLSPWGMREWANGNIKHIGLPAALFTDPSYSAYETAILNALLGVAPGTFWVATTPDNRDIKTLAILAHEMAHILWWHGGVSNKTCGLKGRFFKSWEGVNHDPPRGFHRFGVQLPGNMPIERFTYTDVKRNAGGGNYNELHSIYASGKWAGLFSFVAPDEDFAETYKLVVLSPGLTSLTTTMPSQQVDIMQVLRNPNSTLAAKADWVAGCVNP
jgi:hypothetical protein